jgi:glutamate synthase (NADPH/NADH) small chain
MVHQEEWQSALEILQSTNNFPEFDAYAPLHEKIVLGIIEEPVASRILKKYNRKRFCRRMDKTKPFTKNWCSSYRLCPAGLAALNN